MARPLPAVFASSVKLALHVPGSAPGPTGESSDVLFLGAAALLLFVFSGLMVVRTTAQVMRRERPV